MNKTFTSTPLGRDVRDPERMHTCQGCVNKAAVAGAIDTIGGSVRLASNPRHLAAADRVSNELADAWRTIMRNAMDRGEFVETNTEDNGAGVIVGVAFKALHAIMASIVDIACNDMSPMDRLGYMSGMQRAQLLLFAAATHACHNGVYSLDDTKQRVHAVLNEPIPQRALDMITQMWASWKPGDDIPTPRDLVANASDVGELVQALMSAAGGEPVIAEASGPQQDAPSTPGQLSDAEIDAELAQMNDIMDTVTMAHNLAISKYPPGHPRRVEMDTRFQELRKAHRNLQDAVRDRKRQQASTIKPPTQADNNIDSHSGILEFDHSPSPEEVARGVFDQIKSVHPDAQVTLEGLTAALAGQRVAGVQVIRLTR